MGKYERILFVFNNTYTDQWINYDFEANDKRVVWRNSGSSDLEWIKSRRISGY